MRVGAFALQGLLTLDGGVPAVNAALRSVTHFCSLRQAAGRRLLNETATAIQAGSSAAENAFRRIYIPQDSGSIGARQESFSTDLVLSLPFLLSSSRARCRFGQAPAYGHHTISGASPRGF